MLRLLTLVFFVTLASVAYAQSEMAHEPTSATDAEVRLHNTKKSRFSKASRERESERITAPARESKYKREIRATERHGKPLNSTYKAEVRGTERHGGSSKSKYRSETRETERASKSKGSGYRAGTRQTERHGKAVKKSKAGKREKVKRALGRSNF